MNIHYTCCILTKCFRFWKCWNMNIIMLFSLALLTLLNRYVMLLNCCIMSPLFDCTVSQFWINVRLKLYLIFSVVKIQLYTSDVMCAHGRCIVRCRIPHKAAVLYVVAFHTKPLYCTLSHSIQSRSTVRCRIPHKYTVLYAVAFNTKPLQCTLSHSTQNHCTVCIICNNKKRTWVISFFDNHIILLQLVCSSHM